MKVITYFRKTDIAGQIILLPFCLAAIQSFGPFLFGIWQVTSNIINVIYDARHGKVSRLRKIYTILSSTVITILIILIGYYVYSLGLNLPYETRSQLGMGILYFFFSMLIIGPALAAFYFVLSIMERNRAELQ